MILYHGSFMEIKNPKIIESDAGRDFGFAFYLTPIKEQAEKMAVRKKRIYRMNKAIVSVFEFDEKTTDLNYKKFENADREWLDLIVSCRGNVNYKHDFDIVEGKIADDKVGEIIGYVIEGIMRKEDAIEKLKFQKINSQIAFCTEKALKRLKFIKSYGVE